MQRRHLPAVIRVAPLLLLFTAATSWGHGVPAGSASVRLNGDRVFALFSVPVSLLGAADEDRDGQLSLSELEGHREGITAVVRSLVRVESGTERGDITFEDLLLPHAEGEGAAAPAATHLGVMRSTRFSGRVEAPRLVMSVFEGDQEESQVEAAFLDERGTLLERTPLTRAAPSYRFGAGSLEVGWLHAVETARWLVHAPWAWALLVLVPLGTARFRHRKRVAMAWAVGMGSALFLLRAFAVRAEWGRELPHTLAGGWGATAVLGTLVVLMFGLGISAVRRRAAPGAGGDPSRAA